MRMSAPQHSTSGPFCMRSAGSTPRAASASRALLRMYMEGCFSRIQTKKFSSCWSPTSWQVEPTTY